MHVNRRMVCCIGNSQDEKMARGRETMSKPYLFLV